MDEIDFWCLIDDAREAGGGNQDRQHEWLVATLAKMPESEILLWEEVFRAHMDKAYVAELWEVAFIVNCGCGDDGFIDFRSWLIGQGRAVFESALTDPESLANIIEPGHEEDPWHSMLWAVYMEAWERQTGRDASEMPERPARPAPVLRGGPSDSEEAVLARFPRATARFWKRCQDMAA